MAAYLLVDGSRVDPAVAVAGRLQFHLNLPVKEIRFRSGAAQPVRLGESSDRRQLGIELNDISWATQDRLTDVPVDSPYLVDGFHPVEIRDGKPVRWTNGDAAFPPELIPDWCGAAVLRLSVTEWRGSQDDPSKDTQVRLLSAFESLGEDCEFGLAQRNFGVDPPLTLFRWSGTKLQDLIRGLECKFEGLGDPGHTEVAWSGDEYFLRTPFLSMHTGVTNETDDAGVAEIGATGRVALRMLRRKLLTSITEAKQIFVFASADPSFGKAGMDRLHVALRGVGPASLLCVRCANEDATAGDVERLRTGLYAGYVSAFVGPAGPFDDWWRICRKTMLLRYRGSRPA